MGMHDRDWYRAEQHQKRIRERIEFSRSAKWAMFRQNAASTVINSLAVYGALHLLLRVVKWASG